MPLGWGNDRQKSSKTSVDFPFALDRNAALLPVLWSHRDQGLHRAPRAILVESAERRGHGFAQARLGAERPEPFFDAEQCGRQSFGDGTCLARQAGELGSERIAHVDGAALLVEAG